MYDSYGISFLSSDIISEEYDLLSMSGKVMTFQRPMSSSADIYAGGINYQWYGDNPDFDISNPTTYSDYEIWNVVKLNSYHQEEYGSDTTFGNKVFGLPIMAINTSGTASSASMQIGHTNAIPIEYISTNIDNNTMDVRVISSTRAIPGVGQIMQIAYYDSSLTISPIAGIHPPETELPILKRMTEASGTIIAIDASQTLQVVTVSLDGTFDSEKMSSIAYMAPDNQKLMILPLGTGYVATTTDPNVVIPISEAYPATPSLHNIPSWIYNQDISATSAAATCASPVIDVTLEPNQFLKFIVIGWRGDEIVGPSHGITVGIM